MIAIVIIGLLIKILAFKRFLNQTIYINDWYTCIAYIQDIYFEPLILIKQL